MILEREIKDAKMSSFSFDFQTIIKLKFPLYFLYELSTSFRNIDKNESTFLLPGRKIGQEHFSYSYFPERYINSGASTQFAFTPVTEQHVYRLR